MILSSQPFEFPLVIYSIIILEFSAVEISYGAAVVIMLMKSGKLSRSISNYPGIFVLSSLS